MKKLALLLTAICLTTQVSAGLIPKFKFGVKAGLDYQTSDFKFSDALSSGYKFDLKSNTGWFAGLQGDLTWGMLGIHPELIYSHNSFDVSGMGSSVKYDRLNLPLLAQIKLLGILAIQAGPNFLLMTNTSGKMEGGGCSASNLLVNGDISISNEVAGEMQRKRLECAIAMKAISVGMGEEESLDCSQCGQCE